MAEPILIAKHGGIECQMLPALARGHRDLTDDAGPDLAALFVLTALAVLDVGPFRVSSHVGKAPRASARGRCVDRKNAPILAVRGGPIRRQSQR